MSPIARVLSPGRLAKANLDIGGGAESRETREGPECVAHRLSTRRAEQHDQRTAAPDLHRHQENADARLAHPSVSTLAPAPSAAPPLPAESVQACDRCQDICRVTLHEVLSGLVAYQARLVWLCPRCLDAVQGRWPDIPVAPGNYYGD